MAEYRAYLVGDDGHIIGFEPLVCADDGEAVEKAKRFATKHSVELWSGDRLVKRLTAAAETAPDTTSQEVIDGRTVPKK
jgi:hypothetical protein